MYDKRLHLFSQGFECYRVPSSALGAGHSAVGTKEHKATRSPFLHGADVPAGTRDRK